MSVQLRHKCPKQHSANVSINGHCYRVIAPNSLLHAVVDGEVASSPGVEPGDASDLLQYAASLFERARPEPPAKAKAKPKAVKPEPEPEPEEPDDNEDDAPIVAYDDDDDDEPHLSALDQSVAKLTAQLDTGELDEALFDLLSAEEAGKTRSSAVRAIEERIALLED